MNVRCEILVHPPSHEPIRTTTENLGIGGVCVVLEERLERFSVCILRLQLEEKPPTIEASARVVWAIPTREGSKGKKLFDTGIEFVQLDPESLQTIQKFIAAKAAAPSSS